MQKIAPSIDITPPGAGPPTVLGACPSAEELAAYIDGNLGKAESRHVTEHLASCEDCYAVYMGALQFQLDSSPAEPEGVVEGELVRFPEERKRAATRPASLVVVSAARLWLPIAALLLVGVGGGTYFQFLAPPPALRTTQMPPLLPGGLPNEPMWLGPTYRGGESSEEVKLDEASFRIGVQLVNLQVTLKSGKVREAQDVIARILGLLRPQPFSDDLQKGFTAITVALENGKPPNSLIAEATRLGEVYRKDFEPGTSFDFGQWVEASRLAAQGGDPFFLQQADSRSFLRHFLWRDKLGLGDTKLDPVSRESLDQISEILSKGDLQASDYVKLKEQFDKILEIYYPAT